MSLLSYDRERVKADLHAGALADVAERLYRWNPTEDNEGLALACHLVNALSGDGIPRWALDLDPVTGVAVLAHFSCRDNGLLTYDGDLTVSMLIDGSFEIGDPGISSLDELVEFTAEQDGPARALAVLDAITARLNTVLTHASRFARASSTHRRRTAHPPVTKSPIPHTHVPSIADIAAQSRREISRVHPLGLVDAQDCPPSQRAWRQYRPTAEQLMSAHMQAVPHSRNSIRLDVLARNRSWLTAGCPTTRVVSITPGAGSEYDTEILLSNGLRLLASTHGVLITDTCGRLLHFLDVVDPEIGHDHLDLAVCP